MAAYKPLTPQELKRGYFWLTHRETFKKIFFIVGLVAVVLIYLSLGINIVKLARGSNFQDLAVKLTPRYDWGAYHSTRGSEELKISPVQILSIGNNRYNLVAFVENTNTDWLISGFDYTFTVNGQALSPRQGFVNSQESFMLLYSAYESNTLISSASVNLDKIHWYRRDASLPDIKWDIQDVSFQAASVTLPPAVTWTAQNLSLKNFWQVNWQVALYSGDKLVGAQEIVASDFLSLEKRDLRAVWLYNLPRVTEVKVLPHVGWLDTDNFKNASVDTSGGDGRVNL